MHSSFVITRLRPTRWLHHSLCIFTNKNRIFQLCSRVPSHLKCLFQSLVSMVHLSRCLSNSGAAHKTVMVGFPSASNWLQCVCGEHKLVWLYLLGSCSQLIGALFWVFNASKVKGHNVMNAWLSTIHVINCYLYFDIVLTRVLLLCVHLITLQQKHRTMGQGIIE